MEMVAAFGSQPPWSGLLDGDQWIGRKEIIGWDGMEDGEPWPEILIVWPIFTACW